MLYTDAYGPNTMLQFFHRGQLQSITYNRFHQYATALGAGLHQKQVSCVLTVLPAGPDWDIIDAACYYSGALHVSLPPLTEEDLLRLAIADNQPQLIISGHNFTHRLISKVLAGVSLKPSVFMLSDEADKEAYYGSYFLMKGAAPPPVSEEQAQTVIYTSGSTGVSKGVVLSRANLHAAISVFSKARFFEGCTKALSLLPVSLSGERKLNYSYKANGITICYPNPLQTELEALLYFRPNIVAVVPYLLRKIQEQILVSGKVPDSLKAIVCGGAPLESSTRIFFQERSIPVYEVYGLTETASVLSYNDLGANRPGTVGKVAKGVLIKIEADGELLCKAPNNTKEYKNNAEATEALLTADGYLKTGDIVSMDDEGYLTIAGRKKNIFKGPHGVYIAPEIIEQKLLEWKEVNSAVVCCDEEQKLSALLWLNSGASSGRQEAIAQVVKCNSSLKAAEKIERLYVFAGGSPSLLTSSFKVKRDELWQQLKEAEKLDIEV